MTRSRTPTLKVGSCKTQVNVLSRAFDGGMEERKKVVLLESRDFETIEDHLREKGLDPFPP